MMYSCNELANKIDEELRWIASDATGFELILALSILIGRYGDESNSKLIGDKLAEQIRTEEYDRAKRDFDQRLKKAMEIK